MHLKSGKKLKADCLLYANVAPVIPIRWRYRTLGWKLTVRTAEGQQHVSDRTATRLRGGDVIGYPSLASAAYDQGRIAGRRW